MTANVFRQDIDQCLAAGMNDHVGKPLDFDEVLAKLRKYLPRGVAGKAP
jgi:CheY-like chemotaxis protein